MGIGYNPRIHAPEQQEINDEKAMQEISECFLDDLWNGVEI